METVERDYSPRGVKFFYIYKALAHPEQNGYVAPFTLQERLRHVGEAKKKLGTRFSWICDAMDNRLKHALGNAPNSEFIIDPQGKVVRAQQWSNPQDLRSELARLVGEAKPATTLADLNMKPLAPPKTAAKGVVPRVSLPGRMTALKVRPANLPKAESPLDALGVNAKETPYYVKLRAEVEPSYFQEGSGKLYLGFFLDPLYAVHWNNRAAAITYKLEPSDGVRVSSAEGRGPEVKADADADPREFLLDLSGRSGSIRLTVQYFACDDAETFCKAVTQHYEILLEADRDGGNRRSARGGPGGGRGFGPGGSAGPRGNAGPGRRPGGGFGPGGGAGPGRAPPRSAPRPGSDERKQRLKEALSLFKQYDRDQNGKLTKEEWSGGKHGKADADKDGSVSLQEAVEWLKRI